MSLDVWLTVPPTEPEEVFSANITHNLGRMAHEAGIYEACWRPEEIGVHKAWQLIPLLRAGLWALETEPERFRPFNAENGWGLYEDFVPWVARYLKACEEFPQADVRVSR